MRRKEFFLSPLEGFLACDVDEAEAVKYYGYQNIFGDWIIMRENAGEIRYAYGSADTDYTTQWAARKTMVSYGLPDEKFGNLE